VTDVDSLLLGAKLAEDTVPICTRGDLLAEYKEIGRQIAEERARAAADPRIAGTDGDKLRRAEDLREQIKAATVQFHLRALDRRAWAKLVEEHPPRLVNGQVHADDHMGVNHDTFFPALIRASTVEPQLRDETWEALLDDQGPLTDAQYLTLSRSCWNLNKRDVNVPFSYAALLPTAASALDSVQPEPSASPSNGSTAGSRGGSKSTATGKAG
jgi:hypothetical protein